MHNSLDADFLKIFIYELCQRYIDKDIELEKYVSPAIKQMNKFEREYMERILKDLNS